ncbi:hypothetical protein HPB50_006983 [Hyalomma asiaticum]|uniref:Uncharacterized protein n=1 Tax=Hyalomma asiaticum TaxID=266040 RepID=A0ACB7TC16_HYAAI|nr:hypothetical protein HPB50_006983 [Hyalomma asiaticum]
MPVNCQYAAPELRCTTLPYVVPQVCIDPVQKFRSFGPVPGVVAGGTGYGAQPASYKRYRSGRSRHRMRRRCRYTPMGASEPSPPWAGLRALSSLGSSSSAFEPSISWLSDVR